ncbi:MAG: hypothetical protein J6A68_02440 [Oscillospiraceae bacterium]|nr:hypothetical protein [Oscillospiraceae bacterium]
MFFFISDPSFHYEGAASGCFNAIIPHLTQKNKPPGKSFPKPPKKKPGFLWNNEKRKEQNLALGEKIGYDKGAAGVFICCGQFAKS